MTVVMGSVFFFHMVCLPASCSLSNPQRPYVVVDIFSILLQVNPILRTSLRHLFFVYPQCLGLLFIVFYCEQNYFQSNLNPKESFFFSFLLSRFSFTLTEISVVCCLQFQFYCWNIYLSFQHDTWMSVLAVCLSKPHKPKWY